MSATLAIGGSAALLGLLIDVLLLTMLVRFREEVLAMLKRYRAEIAAVLVGAVLAVVATFAIMAAVGPLSMSV